jgi:hypothetical protein
MSDAPSPPAAPPPAPPPTPTAARPAPPWLALVAWRLALAAGGFLVVVSAFQWVLAGFVGPLGMLVLSMTALPLMVMAMLFAGLTFVLARRPNGGREVRPLLAGLLAFGLATFVPWTRIDFEARWHLFAARREAVVAMVHDGRLVAGNRVLPGSLRAASADGIVTVAPVAGDTLSVLFYTYHGAPHRWLGFLYVTRDAAPVVVAGDSLAQVVSRAPHWYIVASR